MRFARQFSLVVGGATIYKPHKDLMANRYQLGIFYPIENNRISKSARSPMECPETQDLYDKKRVSPESAIVPISYVVESK